MKKRLLIFCMLAPAFWLPAQQRPALIPYPQQISTDKGYFEFGDCLVFQYPGTDSSIRTALLPLLEKMKTAAGVDLEQKNCRGKKQLAIRLDSSLPEEGYALQVQPQKITIRANSAAGVFYAVQTLLQLLPAEIEQPSLQPGIRWKIPCLRISDQPAFRYRGLMLDVARHFMPLEDIKKILDAMAMQKMNRFHWHLTDSQGWRFESKKYPNLVTTGAFRKGSPLNTTYDYASRPDEPLYGGYYTQEQMKELVEYARRRFITVIPEIEMPAHSRSALAAYPHLGCSDPAGKLLPHPDRIPDDSYCSKDETFEFLEGILEEVMAVFPSPFIHIGGDEAPRQNWKSCFHCQKRIRDEGLKNEAELQSYFIRRVERFVNAKGRFIIGWDEILDGGLAPNALVMSWRGTQGGIAAAKQRHGAIMTPGSHCYFDHYQSDDTDEPLAWGGLTTLKKTYSFNPVPDGLSPEEARFILGAQGNLWTEFIPDARHATYMLFPRSTALSEVLWTYSPSRNYPEFLNRLDSFTRRLDAHGIHYSRHQHELKIEVRNENQAFKVHISGAENNAPVHYTLDGSLPGPASPMYSSPFPISQTCRLTAAVLLKEGGIRDKVVRQISMHQGIKAKTSLVNPPNRNYNRGGERAWVNGVLGHDTQFSDDQWLAWNGTHFEGILEFDQPTSISRLSTRFFHKPQSWIWYPQSIEILASPDGQTYQTVFRSTPEVPEQNGAIPFEHLFTGLQTRFLKILVYPLDKIPPGQNGEGQNAWIFIDEMVIE